MKNKKVTKNKNKNKNKIYDKNKSDNILKRLYTCFLITFDTSCSFNDHR